MITSHFNSHEKIEEYYIDYFSMYTPVVNGNIQLPSLMMSQLRSSLRLFVSTIFTLLCGEPFLSIRAPPDVDNCSSFRALWDADASHLLRLLEMLRHHKGRQRSLSISIFEVFFTFLSEMRSLGAKSCFSFEWRAQCILFLHWTFQVP